MVPKCFLKAPLPDDIFSQSASESDILLPDPDNVLEPEERAAKRQKILDLGNNILQGDLPTLLSASLKGPFDGWKNPWNARAQRPSQCQPGSKKTPRNLQRIRKPGVRSSPGVRPSPVQRIQGISNSFPRRASAGPVQQLNDSPQWLRRTFTREQFPEQADIASPLQAKLRSKKRHPNYPPPNLDSSFATKHKEKLYNCSAPHTYLSVRSKHTGDDQYGHDPSPKESLGNKQLSLRAAKPIHTHMQGLKIPNEFTPINAGWPTTRQNSTTVDLPPEVSPQTGLRLAKNLSGQAQELARRNARVAASQNLVHSYQENKRQKRIKRKRSKKLSTTNGRPESKNHESAALHGSPSKPPAAPLGFPNELVDRKSPEEESGPMLRGVESTDPLPTTHSASVNKTNSPSLSNRDTAPARQNSHAYPSTNKDENNALLRPQGAFLDLIPSPDEDESAQSRSDDSSRRLSDGSAITPFHDFHASPLGSKSAAVHGHSLFDRLSQLGAISNGDRPESPENKFSNEHQDSSDRQVSLALSNWHGSQCQNLIRPESEYSKPHSGEYVPSVQPAQQVMGELELSAALDEAGSFLGTWAVGTLGA